MAMVSVLDLSCWTVLTDFKGLLTIAGHVHKRSLDDQAAYEKFLYQQSESSNIQDTVRNRVLAKRASLSDEEMMRTFASQRGETINVNRVLTKRQAIQSFPDLQIRSPDLRSDELPSFKLNS